MISYAQNFEDVILWRALKDVENGCYIDVGANDPVSDSVSKAFYDNGWRGLHVEPVSEFADKLRQARPDEIVVEVALGAKTGQMTFFDVGGSGLSTGVSEISDKHEASGYEVSSQIVPVKTLSSIFRLIKERDVHWLKIDVEGMEKDVLEGWGRSAKRPWIIVVESTEPNSTVENHHNWESLLEERGYSWVYFDGLNRFYLHESQSERAALFGPGPNYFDGFQLTERSVFNQRLVARLAEADQALAQHQDLLDESAHKSNAIGDLEYRLNQSKAEKDALAVALTTVGEGLSAAIANAVRDAVSNSDAALAALQSEYDNLLVAISDENAAQAALQAEFDSLRASHEKLVETNVQLEATFESERHALVEVQATNDELVSLNGELQAQSLLERREHVRIQLELGADIQRMKEALEGAHHRSSTATQTDMSSQESAAIIRAQQADINSLQAQLNRFQKSMSWKISTPVRVIGRIVRPILRKLKPLMRSVLETSLTVVRKVPFVKPLILSVSRLIPPLHRRLEHFVSVRPPYQKTVPTSYVPAAVSADVSELKAPAPHAVVNEVVGDLISDGKTAAGTDLLGKITQAGSLGKGVTKPAPERAMNGSISLNEIADIVRSKSLH